MIRFAINRKTGESRIVDAYDAPGDNPLEALAHCLAKMTIEHGLLKKYQQQNNEVTQA
ncbi:hypothetical protein [Sporomusa acidovorans]|uniref:Uncharacterized protein n=1 Tax=Sporomusa acidovorans (strain ATCC 49682 / DSM 3132 / Mol) TaxID=1123286 RepID=A0ABZ3J7V2_SPOA4|nr:hypothetical protein [Sporomusa acidovorans]OZC24192.1 hypothetical protein SPACI_01670 [Sporomusa acidovorans DSM 3132]SDF77597.1 hypothetical protein SAMN04488499_10816 [Sporomusa acidovorans]